MYPLCSCMQINVDVEREVLNHRQLAHPFIIKFKKVLGACNEEGSWDNVMQSSIADEMLYEMLQVMLTPTHLVVIMEYASGGELFAYVQQSGRLTEDASRFFFQQLITAVEYCHNSGVYHRDLKLENALIDISSGTIPYLKLCDFGFSKVSGSQRHRGPCCFPRHPSRSSARQWHLCIGSIATCTHSTGPDCNFVLRSMQCRTPA